MRDVAELVSPLHRSDHSLSMRIAESALARHGVATSDAQLNAWLASCRRRQLQRVQPVTFEEMRGWSFRPDTGDLVHDSGRFFSVEGIHVRTDFGLVPEWTQPIIHQPEIGILGMAVRNIDGVLHCLVQAKSEPGNINGVQLAPTVQATKSNYMRVHRGSAVPYLEHFREPDPRRVLADVLQSEQGTWFLRKRNRNVVVEVGDDVEAGEDFCWLTLGQLHRLLSVDNLVSMDARTVLSCLPYAGGFADPLGHGGSLHTMTEILSWVTHQRAQRDRYIARIPLRDVQGWRRDDRTISHERGLYFSIIAVDVETNSREVARWTQPLLAPHGRGIIAMLVRRFDGVPHVLVRARVEPGYLDIIELAPTVQCTPENYAHLPSAGRPRFLDLVLDRRPDRVLVDVELAEEGGRFYHAQCRYLAIEVDDEVPADAGPGCRWVTLDQLTALLRHSHYVNIQVRTLVACLRAIA